MKMNANLIKKKKMKDTNEACGFFKFFLLQRIQQLFLCKKT